MRLLNVEFSSNRITDLKDMIYRLKWTYYFIRTTEF